MLLWLSLYFLCVFCGYRVGINLGVHNKVEGNLEIKNTLFQFWVQGHFGPIAKWFDFLPLHWHTPITYSTFSTSLKRHEYFISIFITLTHRVREFSSSCIYRAPCLQLPLAVLWDGVFCYPKKKRIYIYIYVYIYIYIVGSQHNSF